VSDGKGRIALMGRRRFRACPFTICGRHNREVRAMTIEIDDTPAIPKLIDVAEVCRLTSLSVSRIYVLITEGELRRVKIGRKTLFVEAEVKDWIEAKIAASPLRHEVA
jgi:excisionase family DNA binding protein